MIFSLEIMWIVLEKLVRFIEVLVIIVCSFFRCLCEVFVFRCIM